MARLVLVDTAEQLPGLLPLHAWSALLTSELVLVGTPHHPFLPYLDAAELRYETLGDDHGGDAIVGRVKEHGEVAYLFGPGDGEAFTRDVGLKAARAGIEVEMVYFGAAPKGVELLRLVGVETLLRGPDGCPWDKEQTHESLARYATEELYELLEAIGTGDRDAIREELGDVLLQVVFQAQIAEDEGAFTIDDVARGIADKLVRRHPHVFGDEVVADADAVKARWDQLKAAEKPHRDSVFEGIPAAQPALSYAEKLLGRAARSGLAAEPHGDAAGRVRAEVDNLLAAAEDEVRTAALGELLLAAVMLGRRWKLDPEMALRGAIRRYRDQVERAGGGLGGPQSSSQGPAGS